MADRVKHLICVGLGNIGSRFVVLIAQGKAVAHITLIDPDVYESHNLVSQDIEIRDIGRLKVEVMRDRVHRNNPEMHVEIIAQPVERVPLGRLRGSVIATCVDGPAPRRCVNRAAKRLGVPLIDAGLRADGSLVRLDVYEPSADAACLECGWSEEERAAVDTVYPCDPPPVASTGAPAHLGAVAAGLLCAECEKIVTGDGQHALFGRQWLGELVTHRWYISSRRRSPHCGFDHRRWSIQPLPRTAGAITLRQALELGASPDAGPPRFRVHGDAFAHRLVCPECHTSRKTLYLAGRLNDVSRACSDCGTAMVAPGIDTTDALTLDRLSGVHRRRSLYALGLRAGDVFTIETTSGEAHFEIGGR